MRCPSDGLWRLPLFRLACLWGRSPETEVEMENSTSTLICRCAAQLHLIGIGSGQAHCVLLSEWQTGLRSGGGASAASTRILKEVTHGMIEEAAGMWRNAQLRPFRQGQRGEYKARKQAIPPISCIHHHTTTCARIPPKTRALHPRSSPSHCTTRPHDPQTCPVCGLARLQLL